MEKKEIEAPKTVHGFKIFKHDWTCMGKQYTCPGRFIEEGKLEVCGHGMHFCQTANDCFNYYSFDSRNKVAEVIAYGEVVTDGDKSCTDKLEIVREIPWEEVLRIVNTGKNCTGRCNTGNWNTGNWNTGNRNTGHCNTGNRNAGDWNTGDWNTGTSTPGTATPETGTPENATPENATPGTATPGIATPETATPGTGTNLLSMWDASIQKSRRSCCLTNRQI